MNLESYVYSSTRINDGRKKFYFVILTSSFIPSSLYFLRGPSISSVADCSTPPITAAATLPPIWLPPISIWAAWGAASARPGPIWALAWYKVVHLPPECQSRRGWHPTWLRTAPARRRADIRTWAASTLRFAEEFTEFNLRETITRNCRGRWLRNSLLLFILFFFLRLDLNW